jgi:hypothetical protein
MFGTRISGRFVRNLVVFAVVAFLTISRIVHEAEVLSTAEPVVIASTAIILAVVLSIVFVVIDQQRRRSRLRIEALSVLSPEATVFSTMSFASVRARIAALQALSDPVQPARGSTFVSPTVTADVDGITLWRADIIPVPILVLAWSRVSAVTADRLLEGIRYYPAVAVVLAGTAGTLLLPVVERGSVMRRASPDAVAAIVAAIELSRHRSH